MFTIWNVGVDKLEPMFANSNYHPKTTTVENSVFSNLGRGNWTACVEGVVEGAEWAQPTSCIRIIPNGGYLKQDGPTIKWSSGSRRTRPTSNFTLKWQMPAILPEHAHSPASGFG